MKKSIKLLLCAIVIATVCLTVFACSDKPQTATPLDPVNGDSIAYDGATLTWTGVANAEGYTLYFNDEPMGISVGTTSYSVSRSADFKVAVLATADNETYCSATTKGEASFTYLAPVGEITIANRGSETEFDYFQWAPVEGAEYYMLSENGVVAADVRVTLPEGAEMLKSPIATDKNGGEASLSVLSCSSVKNTFSSWSDTKKVTVLATPDKFTFDSDINLIAWNTSTGAISYKVAMEKYTNETAVINDWQSVSAARYVYRGTSESFDFCVKAIGNGTDILDSRIVARSFTKQAAVTGLKIDYGKVTWNPIPGCDTYELVVSVAKIKDGEEYTESFANEVVNGTTYEGLIPQYDEVTSGAITSEKPCSYTVRVRPTLASSDAEDRVTFAGWAEGTFSVLRSPVIDWRGNQTIGWNSVPGAVGYSFVVKKNGATVKDVQTGANTFSNNYDFLSQSGVYTISVVALANSETGMAGANSSRLSNEITVVVLPAPEEYTVVSKSYAIASHIDELGAGVVPQYMTTDENQPISDADAALRFYFNDVEYADYYAASQRYDFTFAEVTGDGTPDKTEGTGTVIAVNEIQAAATVDDEKTLGDKTFNINQLIADAHGRTDTIRLFARSTKNDVCENGTVVLNSSFSTDIVITKLAAPANISISGNKLSWTAVNQSSGYKVYVNCLDNDAFSYVKVVYGTSYELEIADVGEYHIYVAALGNDSVIISSNYSDYITAVKLPAVTEFEVKDVNGEASLSWLYTPYTNNDIEYNPTSYKLVMGTHVEYLSLQNIAQGDSYPIGTFRQFINTSGTTCALFAMGSNNRDDKVVTLNSAACATITLFRLADPSSPEVNADAVTWSGVDHAQGYEIYNAQETLGESNGTETSYRLTKEALGLVPGSSLNFSFAIKAIRNDYHSENDSENSYYIDSAVGVATDIIMMGIPDVTVAEGTGIMSWPSLATVNDYLVKLENQTSGVSLTYNVDAKGDHNTITYDPVMVGSNGDIVRVSVVALGNNIDTIDSFAFSYTTRLEKLAMPVGDFTITPVQVDGYNYFRVSIDDYDAVNGRTTLGRGYYVNVDGLDNFTENGTIELPASNAQEYSIRVCAAGANYGGAIADGSTENVCYINSDYTAAKVVNVLGKPEADAIHISTGGLGDISKRVVEFDCIDNAFGYELYVTYKTAEFGAQGSEAVPTVLEGYPKKVEVNVLGENSFETNGIEIVNNRVRVVLGDITDTVYWIEITVRAVGDDVTSVSGGVASKQYTVR